MKRMETNSEVYKWIMPSIKNRSLKTVPDDGAFNFRIEMARQQMQLPTVDKEKIIEYVNEFLEAAGMQRIDDPHVKPKDREKRRFDYATINKISPQDIIWIKFTTDNYISVIGTSCDISFSEYAKNNTPAGIINKVLNKEWDEKDVLIFPLIGMPEQFYRSDIESGVGNYLISKGVPILDYYSHNY